MSIIIYSANIGGYDNFQSPEIFDKNVRYIMFTDNKYFKSNIWEVYHTDFIDKKLDSRKKARFLKLNPHKVLPHHDISIWVDACYKPRFDNANKILKEIGYNNNVMCYKHNVRNCIYEESKVVINDKLDYPDLVTKQMNGYMLEGFPKNHGLFDSGFMIRKNVKNINEFNETWWNELSNNSSRDQLSQVYSSWKTNVVINQIKIGSSIYSNPYLNQKVKHPKKWLI